jgi:hypothetical protein
MYDPRPTPETGPQWQQFPRQQQEPQFPPPTRPQPVYTPRPAFTPQPGSGPQPGNPPQPGYVPKHASQPEYVPQPGNRPQPGYGPQHAPQPGYAPQPGNPPQQAWTIQEWFRKGGYRKPKVLGIGGAAIVALVVIIVGSTAGSSSGDSAPSSVVQNDGYTLVNSGSGTLDNGIPVSWAEGENSSNVGILIVQTPNASDAAQEAVSLQQVTPGISVSASGDTVTLMDPDGASDISGWLSNEGWT